MQDSWNNVTELIAGYVPNLLGALIILVVGWLLAILAANIAGRIQRRTKAGSSLARWISGEESPEGVRSGRWASRTVFWLVMIFVLVGFFQALGLTQLTAPLNGLLEQIFEYAPRLLGAGLLLLIAWIVASFLRFLVSRGLGAMRLDERLGAQAQAEAGDVPARELSVSKSIAEAVYWLVFLLFLPAILGSLGLSGLLQPVQGMLDRILGILPNLFAAAVILIVGWFVARVVQRIVSSLLAALGTDAMSERLGLAAALGRQRLSSLIGLIIYVLILIPVLVGALNALQLEAVTLPASNMLNSILGALPAIFAALVILAIAYVVGRVVGSLVSNLLAGVGFDALLARMGLSKATAEFGDDELPLTDKSRLPSGIVGSVVLVAILLFAAIEASELLGFGVFADLVAQFTVFAGQVILGLVIFGIGLFLANFVAQAIRAGRSAQAGLLALIARIAILALAGAMALRQMGLADDIINLAFGLLLGAVAVAAALAFGLGGRESAAKQVAGWTENLRNRRS